jgi:hypothetical protein
MLKHAGITVACIALAAMMGCSEKHETSIAKGGDGTDTFAYKPSAASAPAAPAAMPPSQSVNVQQANASAGANKTSDGTDTFQFKPNANKAEKK